MPNKSTLYFPPQKLSIGRKTEKWGKQCIEAGEDLAIFRYNGVRESYKNKLINYNLANDILDTTDLERVCKFVNESLMIRRGQLRLMRVLVLHYRTLKHNSLVNKY